MVAQGQVRTVSWKEKNKNTAKLTEETICFLEFNPCRGYTTIYQSAYTHHDPMIQTARNDQLTIPEQQIFNLLLGFRYLMHTTSTLASSILIHGAKPWNNINEEKHQQQ